MLDQQVSIDELLQQERTVAVALVDDAVTALNHADRQAKDRGIAKAVLRRRALKLLLKARLAARG